MLNNLSKLYAIVDYALCVEKGIAPTMFARAFFNGGGNIIQYRNKVSSRADIQKQTEILLKEVQSHNQILILNDYPEIASVFNISFHIGQDYLINNKLPFKKAQKKQIWGLSTHSLREVHIALDERASYIGFGSIFQSQTKNTLKPNSIDFHKILCAWKKSIVLIGGISLKNIKLLPKGHRIFYAVVQNFFHFGHTPQAIEKYTRTFLSKLA